ncbi:MAG TPA: malectin domain-containing carbohydrate-binding protein [Phycisphaerae bacterium]|nr:malectin domain-containing carbohydrate-binding protein [Phycisphaerae bacterium]
MNDSRKVSRRMMISLVVFVGVATGGRAGAEQMKKYYAHPAVEDEHGVIAPWYDGLNGQCDFRARIAAETLKRYPWVENPATGLPAPHYVYNGHWKIAEDGTIAPQEQKPWADGDKGQRTAFAILSFINYYRYSGDPAAIAHMSMIADVITRHCQTDANHPWPNFLISVPSRGESYGPCNPNGMIQLDIAAQVGLALVRAYQVTGNEEWLNHAKHWADLLAAKRNRDPAYPPWNRYANPESSDWGDLQTGGVFMILEFLDALIEEGYTGNNNALVDALEAGLAYARNSLLPRWTEPDTFGRHYWDWEHPVQCEVSTEVLSRYMMKRPELFVNWRNDVRNIMTLFIHHACTSMDSRGDVFSGAWAYPEGPACCGRSLWYAPLQVGSVFAEYGVRADSEWAREMARRQFILATYDIHPTGVVEDLIDGGAYVAGGWFKIAGPMALRFVLDAIGWLPESLGANRENHLCRSSAVVQHIVYAPGKVSYRTAAVPRKQTDVLRLAFRPTRVTADGQVLTQTAKPDGNGYQVQELSNGDCIVAIRRDDTRNVVIEGDDPQQAVDDDRLAFKGPWQIDNHADHFGTTARAASEPGAELTFQFEGNQFRLIGAVAPDGGQADVWVDNTKQLCGIDCWNPRAIRQQVLYYVNGLKPGKHTVRITATGGKNPLSKGTKVWIDTVQFSAADGDAGFGSGGGPTGRQAWIMGYPGRVPYVDTKGQSWLPGLEVIVRTGEKADPVALTWYAQPKRLSIAGTDDPELYRHGMHAKDFTAYVTVGPGTYRVRLLLVERRYADAQRKPMTIMINGQTRLKHLDIVETAVSGRPTTRPDDSGTKDFNKTGLNRATEVVFDDVQPVNGVIAIRLVGGKDAEAVLSALEVTPQAAAPTTATAAVSSKR